MLKIHRNVPSLMYSTTFLKDICDIEVKVNMCMKEHGCYTYMCHYDLVVCERWRACQVEAIFPHLSILLIVDSLDLLPPKW